MDVIVIVTDVIIVEVAAVMAAQVALIWTLGTISGIAKIAVATTMAAVAETITTVAATITAVAETTITADVTKQHKKRRSLDRLFYFI